jgi:hypothetical protein
VVQLRLRAGTDAWLVLHVEAQGQVQTDFSARMFTYYALVHLRLWRQRQQGSASEQDPMPLILGAALLTDDSADWHPGPYLAQGFGRGVGYNFWVVKLLNWRGREAELAASDNPFALIAHTWLQLQSARNRQATTEAVVRAAMRAMLRQGYDGERAAAVLAVLNGLIANDKICFVRIARLVRDRVRHPSSRGPRRRPSPRYPSDDENRRGGRDEARLAHSTGATGDAGRAAALGPRLSGPPDLGAPGRGGPDDGGGRRRGEGAG